MAPEHLGRMKINMMRYKGNKGPCNYLHEEMVVDTLIRHKELVVMNFQLKGSEIIPSII